MWGNNTNLLIYYLICDTTLRITLPFQTHLVLLRGKGKGVKQCRQVALFRFCRIDSSVKYSDSAGSQSLKGSVLKFVNGPWAQAMSFLDGHGVLAAYPTVHFALIVSGSAPLLWAGQAGGGDAPHSALPSLHDIKVSEILRATRHLNSAWWIKRVSTKWYLGAEIMWMRVRFDFKM